MKTIITRLYADAAAAQAAHDALLERNEVRPDDLDILTAGGDMAAAEVPASAAAAYSENMTGGQALLVYRAPFGAARSADETLADFPAVDVGLPSENVYVSGTSSSLSIFTSHPLFATNKHDRPSHSLIFGKNLITPRKAKNSAISGGRFMSKFFMPLPLLASPKKTKNSAISGGFLFSSMLGMRTVTQRKSR